MSVFSGFLGKAVLGIFVSIAFIYIFVPLLVYLVPFVVHHFFFLHLIKKPFNDYYNLTAHGVRSVGRNFYIEIPAPKMAERQGDPSMRVKLDYARIGVWHILPTSVSERLRGRAIEEPYDDNTIEQTLTEGTEPVIIYLHGNSFDRSTEHRCQLYNILSNMNYHVLAIDYRGYGDSIGTPSEDGVVSDAHAVYEYVRELAPSKNVVVWGHSMGTGVATRLAAELSDVDKPPEALILEAPFNNLRDVIRGHPFSKPLLFLLPWFDQVIIDPLKESGLIMTSDERITRVSCPILVLHAVDDHIIPVELARKLVESARNAKRRIKYVEFESEYEFKHKFIHRHEGLPKLVEQFLAEFDLPATRK